MPPVHRFGWPDRHCGQVPQNPDRQATTWSPTRTLVTSSPTASTMPAPSWPSTIGRSSGKASDTVHDMQIAVADPGRDGAHQHLAAQRLVDIDRFDRQRRVRLAENGGFYLHRNLLDRSEDLPKESRRQAGPVPRERKARYAFRIGWVQE